MTINATEQITENLQKLSTNTYPGRGIILGLTPDQSHFVQVYWIMGRSENSQNRVFVEENGFVKTEAFDAEKLIDPSLIIYYPIKYLGNCHLVTNGDQTETIMDALSAGKSFESALETRHYEPDPPNYTPRISGMIDLDNPAFAYKLSILKSLYNDPDCCIRNFFSYETAFAGLGHCITTYAGDGDPIPSYEGEPFLVKTFNDADEMAQFYWGLLNKDNKVALLVKYINVETKQATIKIINKHI